MINTTHYNLQKAEANEIINSLLPANTNMDKIDTAMFNNLNSGVHNASHTKTGTVHALVRTVTTANFFKFSATDDFRTGDTFTLDGEVITARTQAYAGLPDYAFRTGSEVIAITDHGVLTIYCAGDNITVDDALSPTSENPVQNKVIDGAINELNTQLSDLANYSTAEKAIGTNIDGNTIYQRTIVGSITNYVDTGSRRMFSYSLDGLGIYRPIDIKGYRVETSPLGINATYISSTSLNPDGNIQQSCFFHSNLIGIVYPKDYNGGITKIDFEAILTYTKNTQ